MLNHEIRSDGTVRLTGYVNAVERDSRPIPSVNGKFIESVASGAFGRAIERAGNAIELRFNHGRTIGRRGENLTLKEDAIFQSLIISLNTGINSDILLIATNTM